MEPGTPTADRYLDLVRRFPLRPIRDDASLDAATAMIDELLRLPTLSAEEDDYLDVLGDLVERYEEEAHPIPDAPAPDVVRYLMESRGIGPAELAGGIGMPEPAVSEILAGTTEIGAADIARMADYFGVKAELFL